MAISEAYKKHMANLKEIREASIDPNKATDMIWPRNQRESGIIKQQNDLHDYFHWHHALIGFAVSSLFWGVCFHLWGA
jgi:hypothetical protein